MRCYACNAELKPDASPEDAAESPILINGEPPEDFDPWADHYQFDNALWIGFHGGYGMFVDNMDATMPANFHLPVTEEDAIWTEERKLPGHPDHECVICHDCAHEACEKLPWLKRLIDPWASHAHTSEYTENHPDHWGWDYTIREQPEVVYSRELVRPVEHEVPPAPWNSPTPEE